MSYFTMRFLAMAFTETQTWLLWNFAGLQQDISQRTCKSGKRRRRKWHLEHLEMALEQHGLYKNIH